MRRLVLVFFACLGLCALLQAFEPQGKGFGQGVSGKPTIPEKARQLRESGRREAKPHLHMVDWPVPENLKDLASVSDTILVARCEDKKYRLSRDQKEIQTFYRFKVEEFVKGGQQETERHPIPGDKGGLEADEIIVFRRGGILTIEGVLFREDEGGHPHYDPGRRYLLFLRSADLLHQGAFVPAIGPYGCFEIEGQGHSGWLKAYSSAFQNHLKDNFGSRKEDILRFIKASMAGNGT